MLACHHLQRILTPVSRIFRQAILGGGFAGLTAARTLSAHPNVEVLLIDQREYFEYTPGILRAWVNPDVHKALVNPIRRLLRSPRATFQRVPPGYAAKVSETPMATTDAGGDAGGAEHADDADASSPRRRPLTFSVANAHDEAEAPLVEYECDFAILATGGELSPVSDDRMLPDGTIAARRRRLKEQVNAVMGNASSALVVGGGLTGVELAAELAERLGPGTVTLAVGPTRPERGMFPGDPGAGLLPGFRDTCGQKKNFGRGGAGRHVRKWLERHGVRLLESWAVPPPAGATLANITAAARPSCARTWRDAGDDDRSAALSWEAAGEAKDLRADVVFDCRGLRPNTKEAFTRKVKASAALGLPQSAVAPTGWLWVDERFRLSEKVDSSDLNPSAEWLSKGFRSYDTARQPEWDRDAEDAAAAAKAEDIARKAAEVARFRPSYGGRVYCCGDAAEKDRRERTAANAHAEGEYAALDILRHVDGRTPLPPYVCPPRLCAISLGKWDGVVVLGTWVALRGFLAAIAKMIIQVYFVNFLPLPYWLMSRLPGRLPRRYGGSGGVGADVMLARSGGSALVRRGRSWRSDEGKGGGEGNEELVGAAPA